MNGNVSFSEIVEPVSSEFIGKEAIRYDFIFGSLGLKNCSWDMPRVNPVFYVMYISMVSSQIWYTFCDF